MPLLASKGIQFTIMLIHRFVMKLILIQAQDFRSAGTKIRRKMWLQNMKIKLIVLGILVALILIIVLSVCHGFNCGKWAALKRRGAPSADLGVARNALAFVVEEQK